MYELLDFDKSPKRKMLPNLNDGTTNISDGLVDIKVDINIASGDSAVCHAVKTKLNLVFGVTNPNELASHAMYCLPSGVMSGIAYAYMNSWNVV